MIFYSYIIGLQYNNFVVEFVEFFYCFFSTSEEDYMQNDNQLLHYELLWDLRGQGKYSTSWHLGLMKRWFLANFKGENIHLIFQD